MWIYRTRTLVFVVQLIAIGTCVTEHSRRVRPVTTSGQELPDTGRLRLHRVWLGPHPLQIQRGADDQVFGLFKWVITGSLRLNFDNTLSFVNLKKVLLFGDPKAPSYVTAWPLYSHRVMCKFLVSRLEYDLLASFLVDKRGDKFIINIITFGYESTSSSVSSVMSRKVCMNCWYLKLNCDMSHRNVTILASYLSHLLSCRSCFITSLDSFNQTQATTAVLNRKLLMLTQTLCARWVVLTNQSTVRIWASN